MQGRKNVTGLEKHARDQDWNCITGGWKNHRQEAESKSKIRVGRVKTWFTRQWDRVEKAMEGGKEKQVFPTQRVKGVEKAVGKATGRGEQRSRENYTGSKTPLRMKGQG